MTANIKIDEELLANLTSKFWRLNNLYTIEDKDGNKTILKLNQAQTIVLKRYKHTRKVILKTRQQGISTLFLAYNLDSCIFGDGFSAGIQSYGQDESNKLQRRVELMWNEFPQEIKDILQLKLISNNQKGMAFSNRSILKIGNFRGDTLQSLHVSELGKIARRYPEKAEELRTGAFQAVSINNKITIESTAEGQFGMFAETWETAVLNKKLGKLTPLDFEPIFLSWVIDPDCRMFEEVEIPKDLQEYFAKIEQELYKLEVFGCTISHLTMEQKWWYTKKKEELKGKMKQEYPTFPEEAFEQSIEGTYYKEEYENLKISPELYDENLKVHRVFDLGMNDTFSIGFFQIHPGEAPIEKRTKLIGEYENSGKGFDFYADIFKSLSDKYGWQFGNTYVPHDIAVKELIAGKTRWDAVTELGFNPILVNKHGLLDGIEATRQMLKHTEIDNNCTLIVNAIQNYRKKYDAKYNVYLDSPIHDKYSHTADMLRYLAMGLKYKPITDILRTRYIIPKKIYNGYDI